MKALKKLPLRYSGELHEVHLLNFSVDPDEVRARVPERIRIRKLNGRAMISMVDVRLRNMKARSPLLPFRFHYHHVGFRLLVEDKEFHEEDQHKGIFFLRSFTDKALIVTGGKLLTEFRLERAKLRYDAGGLHLQQGDRYLRYNLCGPHDSPDDDLLRLQETVGHIDRAYSVLGNELRVVRIMREKWPLQPMKCNRFSTNFFESARLEGVFRVPEMIPYTWLPAETVQVFQAKPATTTLSSELSLQS